MIRLDIIRIRFLLLGSTSKERIHIRAPNVMLVLETLLIIMITVMLNNPREGVIK